MSTNATKYVGLDIHKKSITYCIKKQDGDVIDEGSIQASRIALTDWLDGLDGSWIGAMEATLFTGWIYDFLIEHAEELKVAHPQMLKAIGASKKKNDKIDAAMIADLLRVNLLPECWMAPKDLRDLRRVLRFRNLIVREIVRMKNRISGILMETGVEYNSKRLHGKRYFAELMESLDDMPSEVTDLLGLSRGVLDFLNSVQSAVRRMLMRNEELRERVELLKSIPAVGDVTALSWALEIGDPHRFRQARNAVSYCGLCSAQNSSGGKDKRGPISKQRNKHIQRVLIEAAKLAPRHNPQLAEVYERESGKGHKNRASICVARKIVAYLLAVDKSGKQFETRASS